MEKKHASGIVLTLLLIVMLTFGCNIKVVEADVTLTESVRILADGSIYPVGAPVSTADMITYTLTDNIVVPEALWEGAIIVERDNIILDGNEYAITQLDLGVVCLGVGLTGRSHVTIQNMRMIMYLGIHVASCSDIAIAANTIQGTEKASTSIWISDSSDCDIHDNFTYRPGGDIWIVSSSELKIYENTLNPYHPGIYSEGGLSNSIISNNRIEAGGPEGFGIYIESSISNILQDNQIDASSVDVFISDAFDTKIVGNSISGDNNVNILGGYLNTISENTISEGWSGIWLSDTHSNTISANDISSCQTGFGSSGSWNNVICGNKIRQNERGISLLESTGNTFFENDITDNRGWMNDGRGVELLSSSNNRFYHNNFVNNARQVYDYSWDDPERPPSINTWDDGYPSGGNYWSDYTDLDLNNGPDQNQQGPDGIWDHPYPIDPNNADRYPLVKAWPIIPATVDIFPNSVNLKRLKGLLTVYIGLPYGYNVQDIDTSAIRLNDIVKPAQRPSRIEDYDLDGILDLKVNFNLADVKPLLHVGINTLTISGMTNTRPFIGTDTIKVIG